jgi:NAD(P)-dependent dehydrogenase (short-subunit alcohol dehydrogenase family)
MTTLAGKTALVTGASRGIGCATALALAKAGAQVPVHDCSGAAEAEAVVRKAGTPAGRRTVSADMAALDGPHRMSSATGRASWLPARASQMLLET